MIKSLELKNFRRVVNDTMVFGPGLTAIRGPNEGTKSTRIECILYCLFGSKALRTTLDDCVTWGVPVSKLSATLVLEINGTEYTFKRSKGGAEVVVGGKPFVTGQTEVTTFAANLLGVDANTASKLMMASQNGLRGSLEQGPKATATMIETLADFELFERLLERMQEKLLLGAPALLEQRVAQTEQDHANLGHVEAPDVSAFETQAMDAMLKVSSLQASLESSLLPAEAAAKSRHEQAQQEQIKYQAVKADLVRAQREQSFTAEGLAEAQAGVAPINLDRLNTLKADLLDASQRAEKVRIHQRMELLRRSYPEGFWEGTREDLDADIKSTLTKVEDTKAKISKIDSDLRVWKSQKITSSVCGFCNQDVSQFPEVAAKNSALDDQILGGHANHAMWATYLHERQVELQELRDVVASSKTYDDFATRHGELIDINHNFVPPEFSWKGAVPSDEPGIEAKIKAEITKIEAEHNAIRKNMAMVEVMTERLAKLDNEVSGLAHTLKTMPDGGDVEQLRTEVVLAAGASAEARIAITEQQNLTAYADARAKEVVAEYEAYLRQQEQLAEAVSKAKADLARLHFNNNLLKKVRAARPIIADQLWSSVLMAVSTMFSQMRGEASVVTKDNGGFKVNGQAVESLSGSTLDLLGLSIRVALLKTFLPACPFVILDEPAHGCDDDRTVALLGFLASAGFQQTIIVTHDDTSEAVADSLITL